MNRPINHTKSNGQNTQNQLIEMFKPYHKNTKSAPTQRQNVEAQLISITTPLEEPLPTKIVASNYRKAYS